MNTPVMERLVFDDNRLVPSLVGQQNAHLHHIEENLKVDIHCRGNEITIHGKPHNTGQAKEILEDLWTKLLAGQAVDFNTVDSALRFQAAPTPKKPKNGQDMDSKTEKSDFFIKTRKKTIHPRTPMQAAYMQGMQSKNLTFGIGPAGTGKTYLAIAQAVAMMEAGEVERIILSRPAVEAGERLGFLPGEMKEKMDPYMRPLYDALHDTMEGEKLTKKMATEEIEIAPLAFMRGRTLNNAFVILDEAQNATTNQMLMFLTRLGEGSRMVVTGDPGQIDLPSGTMSGLKEARLVLGHSKEISLIEFTSKDVVRSKMVTHIIEAYDAYHKTHKKPE
jgi:phosphate starvation-inducible PhoH-like protein